jgi:hypothetical protein
VLVAALGEALDYVGLVTQQTVEAHNLLSALAYATQHVAATVTSSLLALGLGSTHVALCSCDGLLIALLVGILGRSIVSGLLVHVQDLVINIVDFILDMLDHGREGISDIVDDSVADPVGRGTHVIVQLANTTAYVGRVWCLRVVESDDTIAEDHAYMLIGSM